MTDTKFTFKQRGSVSTGTLRDEDILPVFLGLAIEADAVGVEKWLADQDQEALRFWFESIKVDGSRTDSVFKHMARNRAREWAESPRGQTELGWAREYLEDKINYFCPDGIYFGANEGDGADFGFWEYEMDDDDELGLADASSVYPSGMGFEEFDYPEGFRDASADVMTPDEHHEWYDQDDHIERGAE